MLSLCRKFRWSSAANSKVSFLSVSIHGRWVLNCRDKTSQISITEPLQVETARKIIQKKNMKAAEQKDDTNGIERVCRISELNQQALHCVACGTHHQTHMWAAERFIGPKETHRVSSRIECHIKCF